jgi:hypothetical protein
MAIAQEALKAAEEARSAAEARTQIEAAAEEEAEAQGFKLGEEEAKLIADTTIAQMEARGAFSEPPAPENPPQPAGPDDGAQGPATEPQSNPEPGAAPDLEEPPRKPSLAERFQGNRGG